MNGNSQFSLLAIGVTLLVALSGCGGGGSTGSVADPMPPIDEDITIAPASRPENLAYPLDAWEGSWYDARRNITWTSAAFGTQHYGTSELRGQGAADARRAPVYHDSGHFGGLGLEAPERRLFVGVDQMQSHDGDLPLVARRGDSDVRFGRVRDGAGQSQVARYLESGQASRRYHDSPTVRLVGPATEPGDIDRIVRAVQLVNASLPDDAKLHISFTPPGTHGGFAEAVSEAGRYFPTGREESDTIYVESVPSSDYHGTGTAWGDRVVVRVRRRRTVVVHPNPKAFGTCRRNHERGDEPQGDDAACS